jgi:hypothetical protein
MPAKSLPNRRLGRREQAFRSTYQMAILPDHQENHPRQKDGLQDGPIQGMSR